MAIICILSKMKQRILMKKKKKKKKIDLNL